MLTDITYQVRIKKQNGSWYYPLKAEVYEAPLEDLMADTTKRSAKGSLNTDRIGTYPNLTLEIPAGYNSEQMSELLQCIRPMPFYIDFFDPEIGDYRTDIAVYCKARTPKLLSQSPIVYYGIKLGLTAYEKVSTDY